MALETNLKLSGDKSKLKKLIVPFLAAMSKVLEKLDTKKESNI